MLLGFNGFFYWILLRSLGFYRVRKGFYWIYLIIMGLRVFYWVFMCFFNDANEEETCFYSVFIRTYSISSRSDSISTGFRRFYWVLPSFTEFYWVLLGFIGFC